MDWKEYEEITKHIYETLGNATGVTIICHGGGCKVTGKSKVEHQIDVLTQHSDGIHLYKTAIECKYWDKNITKDIVMKVAEIIEDASLNKGVIVSKNGFTPDAISFAQYKNIGLVELREMSEKDWEGRIQNIEIEVNTIMPQIIGVELLIDKDTITDIQIGTIIIDSLEIKKETGEIQALRDIVADFNNILYDKKESEIFEKTYEFKKGSVIINKPTKQETLINGIKFTGRLNMAKSTVKINGNDHVWLIMKSLFENKSYTISKDKEIRERKDL